MDYINYINLLAYNVQLPETVRNNDAANVSIIAIPVASMHIDSYQLNRLHLHHKTLKRVKKIILL